jgi:hypothetical protein
MGAAATHPEAAPTHHGTGLVERTRHGSEEATHRPKAEAEPLNPGTNLTRQACRSDCRRRCGAPDRVRHRTAQRAPSRRHLSAASRQVQTRNNPRQSE